MGFLKKDGRGRPDFHELRSLFHLFLDFQELSRPSRKTSQCIRSPMQTHGMLGKATINWAHGPWASAGVSPRVSGWERWRGKVSPDYYTTRWRGILACWYQGPLARTSPPNPSSPRPISAHFLTLIFFFHRETAQLAGMDQTQRVPYTHSENNSAPLLATGIVVPALLRDDSNTSTYTWILSNFTKLQ